MLTGQIDIAAIITARICHDLVSPIGAISNGLELLALSGAPPSPELALISESVKAANAKLQFLRIAFGDVKAGSVISTTKVADILQAYYNDPRTVLDWTLETPLDRRDLRLLFLLLLCAEKLAPLGGNITVMKAGSSFKMTITGKKLNPEGFIDFKTHSFTPQDSPPLIQFNLVRVQLDQMGYRMEFSRTSDALDISITP